MSNKDHVFGYCRISVDDNLDDQNTSIENQRGIITDFVKSKFPNAELLFFEDRDKSGYTFEHRPGYQTMRKLLLSVPSPILVIKDFSRFSRRNSKGLCELEDLRDAGVRIISIGDAIDYPTEDEWIQIQFRFLINEMPITDTSRKVKSVISRMQNSGTWICTVPYGYEITDMKNHVIAIDEEAAITIREIFSLYINGWGYKKIANYLTDKAIPTPRMHEKRKIEEQGGSSKRKASPQWSIVSIQTILTNDFYIGTLRQHKFTRGKINGTDVRVDDKDHIVFENHHEPIIDIKTWAIAQELMKKRSTSHYRGQKKYANDYTGLLFCGDCGSPMFSMSRPDIAPAYTCGTYHKRGLKGCTSHHIRVDFLDSLIKEYIKKVRDNSKDIIDELKESIKINGIELDENAITLNILTKNLEDSKNELKAIQRRKAKDILKLEAQLEASPSEFIENKISLTEETYQELEDEISLRIFGLQEQLEKNANRRHTIVKAQRLSQTVIDVFDDILAKPKLDSTDLQLIVDRIDIYTDHINIQLKSDIDSLLKYDEEQNKNNIVNFRWDSKVLENDGGTIYPSVTVRLKLRNQSEQLFTVNVIQRGSPSRIRSVRRISLGTTIRPRSSILRTMPVAFINSVSSILSSCHAIDQLCVSIWKTCKNIL